MKLQRTLGVRSPARRWLTALGVTCLVAGAQAARGQSCEADRLVVEGSLAPRWTEELPSLCALLHDLPDVDVAARVVLRPSGRDLTVTATLSDGRVTSRRLRSPAELLTTVEALIVVPPSRTIQSDALQPVPTPPAQVEADAPRASVVESMPLPRLVQYELGASLMSRVEGSPTYVSLGLQGYASIHMGSLSVAIAARWDGFQSVVRERPPHLEMSTEGGGLWALYRFVTSSTLAVDAGLSIWMLAVMQTHSEGADERGGTVFDVRTGPMVRARFGSGALRTTAGLDLELSRRRLRDNLRLDRELPTLPAWGLGLTVGVVWQSR